MEYRVSTTPFLYRQLSDDSYVAVSESADHAFLDAHELRLLATAPGILPYERLAELKSKFFVQNLGAGRGSQRLLKSRQAAKQETVSSGPSLHIIVTTLQCGHTCKYCQVSRSLDGRGFTMSVADLEAACDAIFESQAPTLTVEFQGGDPLIRFDLIQHAVLRIKARNLMEGRRLRFVVASTLHQLTEPMCAFFKEHQVYLSTSIDGPAELHNRNRPIPGRNSYERTLASVELARRLIGPDSVSALMTTTRESLAYPEQIVDEYVRLGLHDIFIRPLSSYGFAKRGQASLGYTLDDFFAFYERCLDRVIYWNRKGIVLREVYASIILNKLLSSFDAGYVDLQSPTGAGLGVLVYNYDGYVYPSDEARMVVESGDTTLRLGRIGTPLSEMRASRLQQELIDASQSKTGPDCSTCAYNAFCGPNPVDAHAQHGSFQVAPHETEHCQRHMRLFDLFFTRLRTADKDFLDMAYRWANPAMGQ
jgi:His-Xaa-Ser system radical SAM maturase HxsB